MPINRAITRANKKKCGCGLPLYSEVVNRDGRQIKDPTAHCALRKPRHGKKDYDFC